MIKKIDCLGDFCPIPVIKAKIGYKEIEKGDKLIITTDHSCTLSNIKDTFKNVNCYIHYEEKINGIWEITIEKLD